MKLGIKILSILLSVWSLTSCLGPEVSIKPNTAAHPPSHSFQTILVEAFVPHPDYQSMLEEIFRYHLQEAGIRSITFTELFYPTYVNNEAFQQKIIKEKKIDAILQIQYNHSQERMLFKPIQKGSWAQLWADQDENRSFTLNLMDTQTGKTVWSSEAEVSYTASLDDSETDILYDFGVALAQKTVKEFLKNGLAQATGKMFE